MADLQKRKTLKRLSVATMSTVVLSTNALGAVSGTTTSNQQGRANQTYPHGISDLLIDIVASSNGQPSTITLTNLTNRPLSAQHFAPGSIVFGEHYLDLNGLRGTVALVLEPAQSVQLQVKLSRYENRSVNDYVWADDAMVSLNAHSTRVTLGAYQHARQLVVYPIPQAALVA